MKEMIKSLVDSYENQLLETRHHLHANPELSFEEYKTAEYIRENLTRMGIELQEGISGTSTVGILKGAQDGPCIAFRADIDALPVDENNSLLRLMSSGTNDLRDIWVRAVCEMC